jgi:hypothetical protein
VLMSSSEPDDPDVLSRLLADLEAQAKPPQPVYAAASEAIERNYEVQRSVRCPHGDCRPHSG